MFSFCYYYQTSRFYRISTLFPLAYFVDTVIYTFLTTEARVVQACHPHFTHIFLGRTHGDFTKYAQASKTSQLQSHSRYPNH